MNDCDALKIGGNLFECIPFGYLGGESDRILTGIPVSHAMLALRVNDPDVSEGSGCGYES
jgi:hypothetical protein